MPTEAALLIGARVMLAGVKGEKEEAAQQFYGCLSDAMQLRALTELYPAAKGSAGAATHQTMPLLQVSSLLCIIHIAGIQLSDVSLQLFATE